MGYEEKIQRRERKMEEFLFDLLPVEIKRLELKKRRIEKIQRESISRAQRRLERLRSSRRKKSAIGKFLQEKLLLISGGNKRLLHLTSEQIDLKIVEQTQASLSLEKKARKAQQNANDRYRKSNPDTEQIDGVPLPRPKLNAEELLSINAFHSSESELNELVDEFNLRRQLNSY